MLNITRQVGPRWVEPLPRTPWEKRRILPGPIVMDETMIRDDFPALETDDCRPRVYLDNAATTLKPWPVVSAMLDYLTDYTANVHRGIHQSSERATAMFEASRDRVAHFLNARSAEQIVFTQGTTASINLVARGWGDTHICPGDEILVTLLEHHSNLVPWQMLARRTGARLRFVEIHDNGELDLESFENQLSKRTRLVAVTAMSNVLGTVVPIDEICRLAHHRGALVLVDAAQSAGHLPIDVQSPEVDFLAFSAHKVYGPTGVGVLYARRELLEAMSPVVGGGGMVSVVTREQAEWNEIPARFEAGTPPIAEVIGLGAALAYVEKFDRATLIVQERGLLDYAHRTLGSLPGLSILGPGPARTGPILAFNVDGIHPHDLASLLDRHGVAIRAGAHCAQPLHERLGLTTSARASFAFYNTRDDIDALADAVENACAQMRRHRRP